MFYVFNDIFIHISSSKAKHKANLTKQSVQWPLHLVWICVDSDAEQTIIIGPSDRYTIKMGTNEVNQFITKFQEAIDKGIENADHKRDKNITTHPTHSSSKRFGAYRFENSVYYEGDWFDGQLHGKGVWKFLDHLYEGEFQKDKKSGKGKMNYFNGDIYEGEWENDLPHGQGILQHDTGEKYEGEFENGSKTGCGIFKFINGDTYDGHWMHNLPDGLGTFTFHSGISYIGNFSKGRYHGYGVMSCTTSGISYEGEWKNGRKDGKGKQTYKDKSTYEGFWKAGQRHGKGTYKSDVEGSYTGEWQNDVKHGKGEMEYISGNLYSGDWVNGLFHGNGKMMFTRGSVSMYNGEWKRNTKNGKGILHFTNGSIYEGSFKNNMMHGNGTFTYPNGLVIEGKWVEGELEGKTSISTLYDVHNNQTYYGEVRSSEWSMSELLPSLHFHRVPDIHFDGW